MTIQKLKTGKWKVTVDVGYDPITGDRARRSITLPKGSTKDDARDVQDDLRRKARRGAPTTKATTIAELIEDWWSGAELELAPRSRPGYRRHVDNYLLPTFGALALHKLRADMIDRFYTRLRTKGGKRKKPLSVSTIRKLHATFNGALEHGVTIGHLRENPAERIKLPGNAKKTKAKAKAARKYVPVPIIAAVLDECDQELNDAAFLAMATASREGEACGARWSGIDWDAGTLTLDGSVGEVAGVLVHLYYPECKSEERTLAVDAGTMGMLRRRRKTAAEFALACGVSLDPDGYVLSVEPGSSVPVNPQRISERWRNAAARAGTERHPTTKRKIPLPVRFHDLRHFTISHWLDGGMPIPEVVRGGGWTSPQMIAVYGHATRAVDRRGAEVMGDILDGMR